MNIMVSPGTVIHYREGNRILIKGFDSRIWYGDTMGVLSKVFDCIAKTVKSFFAMKWQSYGDDMW